MFDKEVLPYKVGGLLYMPAFQKNIVQKIAEKKLPHLNSAAFCLEDSIRDESLEDAETSLKYILQELEGIEDLPLIFVRIRSPRHLETFHEEIGSRSKILTGYKDIHGGRLIEIIHFDKEVISPVPDDEPIMGGDRLVFAGQIDEILDLKKSHGFVNADHLVFSMGEVDQNRQLRTAYIPLNSGLIHKKMGQITFEKDTNMVLVAVARQGRRLEESPHEVKLHAGDTLLFECPPRMNVNTEKLSKHLQFFDSEQVPNIGPKTLVSSLIMMAMVVLSALKVIPLLQCAFLAAFAMLFCRCCSPNQAMKAINWDILMVFAGSVVLGLAIQKTGIAERLAYGILDVCGTNPIFVMTAICLVATFTTEFISNTAAGAMFFPIMYEAAEKLGYEPYPFLIALMISVSSSFATPIGSPTHMLVYGPGGYRFSDFMRIGLLMNIIILAANIFIVNVLFPLTPLT